MHITNEGLLTQLGYNCDNANLSQLQTIATNTPGYDQIKKHIVALNDHLKNYGGFVAMSNSQPYFKVKIESDDPLAADKALDELTKWADKYKVTLQKVDNKRTYYILGINS